MILPIQFVHAKENSASQAVVDKAIEQLAAGVKGHSDKEFQSGLSKLKKLGEAGNGSAAFNVSVVYSGITPEFPKDEEKRCYWLNKAAELGYVDAYYGAAFCSMRGENSSPVAYEKKMLPWIRKIAAEGNAEEREEALADIKEWEHAKSSSGSINLNDLISKLRPH
jgi:TPR repeat protein